VKRAGLVVGTLVCLALTALIVLLAADLSRWRDVLRADDVRYREAPSARDLWNPDALLPLAAAKNGLGVEDDLEFRRAVRALRLGKLEETRTSDTKVLLQRAEAQARLEAIAAGGDDAARRSRAMTLLGVLFLATPVTNSVEQAAALKVAVTNLQKAIALNPDNGDAKFNLEFALRQRSAGLSLRGGAAPNPAGSPNTSRGAATGSSGSGY
jgi:CheY-like chemotaxis protein